MRRSDTIITSRRDDANLDGDEAFGKLRNGTTVGDLNGDGFSDLVLSGDNEAYLLFGPVDVSGRTEPLSDLADLKIDLSGGLDSRNWTPVESATDIDGDGRVDLMFHRFIQNAPADITLDVAVLTGEAILAGATSVNDEAALVVSIEVTEELRSQDVDIQWMNYDSTPEQELMVFTALPVVDQAGTIGHGGVLPPSSIRRGINGGGPAVAGEMVAWLLNGGENNNSVMATLGSTFQVPSSPTLPLSLRQYVRATPMDTDGDGQDEIVLNRPLGWIFQDTRNLDQYVTVGRTYVFDINGGVGGSLIGSLSLPAVIQLETKNESQMAPLVKDLISTTNPRQPMIAADFNFDGTDELVLARGASDSNGDLLVFENVGGSGLQRLRDASMQIANVVSGRRGASLDGGRRLRWRSSIGYCDRCRSTFLFG